MSWLRQAGGQLGRPAADLQTCRCLNMFYACSRHGRQGDDGATWRGLTPGRLPTRWRLSQSDTSPSNRRWISHKISVNSPLKHSILRISFKSNREKLLLTFCGVMTESVSATIVPQKTVRMGVKLLCVEFRIDPPVVDFLFKKMHFALVGLLHGKKWFRYKIRDNK